MSTVHQELELITHIKAGMLQKLRSNNLKQGWKNTDVSTLFRFLLEEVKELQHEIHHGGGERSIYWECCDIANYAAMIADAAKIEAKKKAPAAKNPKQEELF